MKIALIAAPLIALMASGCAEMARQQAEFEMQCAASGRVIFYQPGWGNVCVTQQEAASRQAAIEREKDREAYLAGECMRSGRTWTNGTCRDFRPPANPLGSSGGSSGRWESATLTGDSRTGDILIKRCHYRTIGGYTFSTDVREGVCPYSVEVQVESGQVRRR